MIKLLTYLLVLSPLVSNAQVWKDADLELVKKDLLASSETFRSPDFSVEFERSIFRHYADLKPMSTSKGMFIRGKGKEYSSVSDGQVVIQTNTIKMVVDTAQNLIILVNPDTLFNPVNMTLLTQSDQWENYTFKRSETDQQISYQMLRRNKQSSAGPTLEIRIDKRTKQLSKIVVYMAAGNYFSETIDDDTQELPMVVVEYKQRKAGAPSPVAFDLGKWVSVTNDTYTLNPSMVGKYRLEDLRYNPNHTN